MKQNETRRGVFAQAILSAIAFTGVLAVGMVAPNALQILGALNFEAEEYDEQKPKAALSRALKNLIAKGYIEFAGKHKDRLRLSPKGAKKLRELELRNMEFEMPGEWDKKWRVVVFDIKEAQKKDRDNLRRILMQIGFYRLQNSVWVFPYECEKLIGLLKTGFDVGKDVLYMTVDKIENDDALKDHFEL